MKLLSEQIRDLVKQSATSPNAIARAAGIDSASMSRFMKGGNITVNKLDQLAKVLGVIVESEVSSIPLPPDKGRPKEKEMLIRIRSRSEAKEIADHFANDAALNHFSSRRGVWHLESYDRLLFIYNNNPWAIDPQIRIRELARVRRRLNDCGIKILAEGCSSEEWEHGDFKEAYTKGFLLACGEDRQDEVESIVWQEAGRAREEVQSLISAVKDK